MAHLLFTVNNINVKTNSLISQLSPHLKLRPHQTPHQYVRPHRTPCRAARRVKKTWALLFIIAVATLEAAPRCAAPLREMKAGESLSFTAPRFSTRDAARRPVGPHLNAMQVQYWFHKMGQIFHQWLACVNAGQPVISPGASPAGQAHNWLRPAHEMGSSPHTIRARKIYRPKFYLGLHPVYIQHHLNSSELI